MTDERQSAASGEPTEVLEVFGMKLKVYNPRLAELLTMEAKEALRSDVVDLVVGGGADEEGDEPVGGVAETPPEAQAPAEPTPAEAPAETDHLQRIGHILGFDAGSGGAWKSSTGIQVLVRRVGGQASLDEAAQHIRSLSDDQRSMGQDAAALFVVDDQIEVDTFRVAIRKASLYSEMRVISERNLEEIARLRAAGRLSHRQVVLLMVPLADIDVGELLNVVRASGGLPGS